MCGSLDPRAASSDTPQLSSGIYRPLPLEHSPPSIPASMHSRSRSGIPVHSGSASPGVRRFRAQKREIDTHVLPVYTHALADLVADSQSLFVDVRPFSLYSNSRLVNATSICVPSTLLKRQTFGMERILDFVPACDVEMVRDLTPYSRVCFYDQSSQECAVDSTISRTAAKLLGACSLLNSKMFFIVGGMDAVQREAPELVISDSKKGEALETSFCAEQSEKLVTVNKQIVSPTQTSPGSAGHPKRDVRAPTQPKLVLSNIDLPATAAAAAKDLKNSKKTAVDETMRISAPPEAQSMLHMFPQWLANAIEQTQKGHNVLAEGFNLLEQAEHRRTNGSTVSSPVRKFSPSISSHTPNATLKHSRPFTSAHTLHTNPDESDHSDPNHSPGLHKHSHKFFGTALSVPHHFKHASSNDNESNLLELPKLTPTSLKESPTTPSCEPFVYTPSIADDLAQSYIESGSLSRSGSRNKKTKKHAFYFGNPRKNRYSNIMPYQFNRVVVRGGSYLNASYTSSQYSPLRYIATQAPVPASFNEFWWCVWEQNVPVIVMLTNLVTVMGRVKSHVYWEEAEYSGLKVKVVSETNELLNGVSGMLKRRVINLSLDGEQRRVVQLHYEGWPDLGCPSNPEDVLELVRMKNEILKNSNCGIDSYTVVHCSAGCGRTGTFCTIDTVLYYLDQLDWNSVINEKNDVIMEVASEFRDQRVSMVQTQGQLLLCYECIILYCMRRL